MLALLYMLVFYTELTDEEYEFRSNLGLLSIFLVLSNVAVHVTLLFVHSFKTGKRFIKRKCYQKKALSQKKKTKKEEKAAQYAVEDAPDKEILKQP